jgi:hypothetical protein
VEDYARSAKEFVDRRVELEAKRLLAHGDRTAAQISDQLGFVTPSQFSKYFHSPHGTVPVRIPQGCPRTWQSERVTGLLGGELHPACVAEGLAPRAPAEAAVAGGLEAAQGGLLPAAWHDRRVTGRPGRPGRMKYVLFDVDGTLIDAVSNQCRVWGTWALRYGLDADEVYRVALRTRPMETFAQVAADRDASECLALLHELEDEDVRS